MSSPLRLMFTTTNLSVLHVNYIPTKRQNRWIINESSLFLSVKFLQDDTKPFTDIFIGESPQSRSTWRTNSIGCLLTQCDSSSIWCNFLKKNCTVFGVFCRPTTPTPLQPHPTPPHPTPAFLASWQAMAGLVAPHSDCIENITISYKFRPVTTAKWGKEKTEFFGLDGIRFGGNYFKWLLSSCFSQKYQVSGKSRNTDTYVS